MGLLNYIAFCSSVDRCSEQLVTARSTSMFSDRIATAALLPISSISFLCNYFDHLLSVGNMMTLRFSNPAFKPTSAIDFFWEVGDGRMEKSRPSTGDELLVFDNS